MLFSLIVATRGRTEELSRLFDSLLRLDIQDFEVILSDQNEDDRLDPVIVKSGLENRLIHIKSTGGLSRGRNAGLDIARGDLVGFPDDDCVFPPDILKSVADFFAAHHEYGMLTGRACDDTGKNSVSRFSSQAAEIERFKVHQQGVEFSYFIRRGALASCRFDEHMGVGSRSPWHSDEGPDLILRLQVSGVRCYYDPRIAIWHPPTIVQYGPKEIDRAYRYALGNGYFYRKHAYPTWYFTYFAGRAFAGALLALATFRLAKARFYFARVTGMWRGWRSTPIKEEVAAPPSREHSLLVR
jgi:glycosyltransferase involved in cell wall biosynthesis